MNINDLYNPFPPERISWRVGSTNKEKTKGLALAYIDARDVMERLDEVCGAENWQCKYPHANSKTVCELGLKIDNEWIWKSNGAGDTDYEGQKGAMSDAFKRAAVLWGIGRYLYDIQSMWVAIEARGNSYKIAASEYPKLQRLLGVKSSAQLRKEGVWEEFMKALLDCKSTVALDALKEEYNQKRQKDGWNNSFNSAMRDEFQKREKELTHMQEAAE